METMSTTTTPSAVKSTNPARRIGVALLIALFLLLYGRYLAGFAPSGGDIVNQYLPYQALVRGSLHQGAAPYWNQFTFCGRPLMADIQVGVLYPPNWLHWFAPLPLSFALLLALHGAWMLAGCWRLGRYFRLEPAAIALGAVLFAASPFFTLKASQGIVLFIYAGAWWPWVALATARLVERPGFARLALLAIALSLSLLAGSPQITYYGWLAAGVLALAIPAGGAAKSAATRKVGALAWLAGAFALAAGLTAIQTMQTASFIGSSFERGAAGGAGWEYITDGSLMPRLFWLLVNPGFLGVGQSEGANYFGSSLDFAEACFYAPLWAALLLAPLGAGAWRWLRDEKGDKVGAAKPGTLHRRLLLVGHLAMLLGAALALGEHSPLFKAFYYVFPGFNRFRVPARLMIFFFAGEALVAAVALHALLRARVVHREARAWIALGAAVALALVWAPFAMRVPIWGEIGCALPGFFIQRGAVANTALFEQASAHALVTGLSVSAGVAMAAAILWALAGARGTLPHLAWALPALAALELFVLALPFQKTTFFTKYEETFYPQTQLVKTLQSEHRGGRVLWLDDVISWTVDQNQPEIYPNRLVMHGLPEARGYDPVNARWIGMWMNLLAGRPAEANPRGFMFTPQIALPAWLTLMGVESVVSYTNLSTIPGLKPVWQRPFREGTLTVWRNERFQGMAFAAGMPKVTRDEIQALLVSAGLAANPATPPAQAVAVTQAMFGEAPPQLAPQVDERFVVKKLESIPNQFRYEVDYPAPALLCLAQSAYGGWSATVDGEPVQPGMMSGAFLAAAVPAGKHVVVFDFLPEGLAMGRMISLAALVALAYGLARVWMVERKAKKVK